jgi:hypothetical protein
LFRLSYLSRIDGEQVFDWSESSRAGLGANCPAIDKVGDDLRNAGRKFAFPLGRLGKLCCVLHWRDKRNVTYEVADTIKINRADGKLLEQSADGAAIIL